MKIDFTQMPVKATLKRDPEVVNLTELVSEAVYQNATDFEMHKFAHRISESEGTLEISDKEAQFIRKAIKGYKFIIQMPILEALGDKFE